MTDADLAAVMRHAADQLDRRERPRDPTTDHGFGGAVYALLHHAAQDLFAAPAIEALRRHLGVKQVQHAGGSCADLLKALTECADRLDADEFGDTPALRYAAAYHSLEEARGELAEALGWAHDPTVTAGTVVREAAEQLRRREWVVERPRGDLASAQKKARELVDARDKVEATVRRVGMLTCWRNEDGKRFVFADDLYEALTGAPS